ncbi:hypothetical protein KDW82_20845 [Burkholderia vietnamiensis]|uniref:hypothetical protein n=1 Tax=Burkholderia vietnamiensis TaxID=60552 RepID=UPI001B9E98DE|nr:hypothetical protein [Burkholderia vietnamiensis]MBR8191488.1 hypothetical protein [Burkholderia vietnamiensis]
MALAGRADERGDQPGARRRRLARVAAEFKVLVGQLRQIQPLEIAAEERQVLQADPAFDGRGARRPPPGAAVRVPSDEVKLLLARRSRSMRNVVGRPQMNKIRFSNFGKKSRKSRYGEGNVGNLRRSTAWISQSRGTS